MRDREGEASVVIPERERDSTARPVAPEPLWNPGSPHAKDNLRGHLLRGLVRLGVLVIADCGAVFLGRLLIRSLRSGLLGPSIAGAAQVSFPEAAVSSLQLAVAVVLALLLNGSYRSGDHWREPARILTGVALATLLALYGDLWVLPLGLVLMRALLVAALLGLTITSVRLLLSVIVKRIPRSGMVHRVLEVRGVDSPESTLALGAGYRTLARLEADELPEDMEAMDGWLEGGVDTILVSGQIDRIQFGQLTDFALAQGCRLLTLPRSMELVGVDPKRLWLNGYPLVELTAPGLRASHLVLKRVVDIVGSAVLLMILSPLFGLVSLLIMLDSKGPVLFRHRRAGLRGRFFELLKFRSMRADAEETLLQDPDMYRRYVENNFKLPEDDDPRITRLGRFLRKTSLDELPQLLNVLKGDMSLVGPRPVVEAELAMYSGRIPTFLSVKPGVTGYWQVSGRSTVTFPERAEMDLEYVRKWSLLGDMWILAMTIPAVLIQRGAH